MFNNNITNFDNKLVNAVQQDYLHMAANRRLCREAHNNNKAPANGPFKWFSNLMSVVAL